MYFDKAVMRTSDDPIIRMVVCAANRNEYGDIILGARHYDHLMHTQIEYNVDHTGLKRWLKCNVEQGFIDQFGVFMDRKEAWKVAMAADQIRYRCGGDNTDGGTLYSENLY